MLAIQDFPGGSMELTGLPGRFHGAYNFVIDISIRELIQLASNSLKLQISNYKFQINYKSQITNSK